MFGNLFGIALAAHAAALLPGRRGGATATGLVLAGVAASGLAVVLRLYHAWPMQAMSLGLPALAVALGCARLMLFPCRPAGRGQVEALIVQGLVVLLCLAILFFPRDFYLPLVRSATTWAHLFLVTGVLARTCLLVSAARALAALAHDRGRTSVGPAVSMAVRGVAFLTLSMFSGGVWSYLGWGTPVVWHDPAVTLVVALWFSWLGILHLAVGGIRGRRALLVWMVFGGLLVLVTTLPDLGPFRVPTV